MDRTRSKQDEVGWKVKWGDVDQISISSKQEAKTHQAKKNTHTHTHTPNQASHQPNKQTARTSSKINQCKSSRNKFEGLTRGWPITTLVSKFQLLLNYQLVPSSSKPHDRNKCSSWFFVTRWILSSLHFFLCFDHWRGIVGSFVLVGWSVWSQEISITIITTLNVSSGSLTWGGLSWKDMFFWYI